MLLDAILHAADATNYELCSTRQRHGVDPTPRWQNVVDDIKNAQYNTLNPNFYRSFELPTMIPGNPRLTIEVTIQYSVAMVPGSSRHRGAHHRLYLFLLHTS